MNFNFLILVVFSAIPFFSFAENLFQWQPSIKKSSSTLLRANVSHSAFSINTQQLEQSKLNESFTVNLPNKESYQAKITRIKNNKNGIKHLVAQIKMANEALPVVITLGKSQFFMRIVTPTDTWVAQGSNGQGQIIKEFLLTPQNSDEKTDAIIPSKDKQLKTLKSAGATISSTTRVGSQVMEDQEVQQVASDEVATIDVLFVYSLTAAALYDNDITARLNHIVEVANQTYIDSGVKMEINIANTLAVDYPDTENVYGALRDIKSGTNEVLSNVSSFRDESGADMVVFLRPYDGGGIAGLASANPYIMNNINNMYSTVAVDTQDSTLVHELGHNMGLNHSRAQGSTDGFTFPYAIGYRVENGQSGFATVMAYGTANSPSVYKFSSPNRLCGVLPCGIDKDDFSESADASYALNQVRFQLQELSSSSIQQKQTLIDAVNNIVDINLKSCIDEKIISENITSLDKLNRLSCWNLNITELTGIDSFKSLNYLSLHNNNIQNIADFELLTSLSSLYLSSNQITNIEVLSHLSQLTSLDLSDNPISDIASLSNISNLSSLYLNRTNVSNIEVLSHLSQLTLLDLSDNPISDIASLSNISNLSSLSLSRTNVSNIEPLSSLYQLRTLSLGSDVNNIESLSSLQKLENITLGTTTVSDISSLFSPVKDWNLINLSQSNNIYCWQQDYLSKYANYSYFYPSSNCNTADDLGDVDGDGVDNSVEIDNNTNPIHHNEQSGSIEFQLSELTVNESSATIKLNIVRINGSLGEISVDIISNEKTATMGGDYSGLSESSTLTLADGELFTTVDISIMEDDFFDSGEQFTVELLNPQGTTLGDKNLLTVTIIDQDPVLFGWENRYLEVNENDNVLNLTITRPEGTVGELPINVSSYSLIDNTVGAGIDSIIDNAVEVTDYEITEKAILFAEGEYSKSISVDIIDNDNEEDDKYFRLMLTYPEDSESSAQIVRVKIIDDDTPVDDTPVDDTPAESGNSGGGGSTSYLMFLLILTGYLSKLRKYKMSR